MRFLILSALCLTIVSCNKPDQQLTPTENPPVSTTSGEPIVTNPLTKNPSPPPTPEQPPKIELKAGENFSLAEFGLKPYPNLIQSNSKPQSSITRTNGQAEATLTQFTKDKPAKVADYFSSQISTNKSKSVTATTAVVGGITTTGAKVFIVATKINNKTQISISATFTE